MAKMTKRKAAFVEQVDAEKTYTLAEAVQMLKASTAAKFDESIEVAMNLGVDPKHADQQVRGTVALPNGTGKTARVIVFAKDEAADEAKAAGADFVGAEDLVKKIEGGWFDFDRVVATPNCMPMVGKLGQVLGPKGLMPNPKLGTVTPQPGKVVKDIKSGMIQFKVEKNGIIHAGVGKKSFDNAKIEENIRAFVAAVKAAKPTGAKGIYMRKMAISSTMGPGIKVEIATAS